MGRHVSLMATRLRSIAAAVLVLLPALSFAQEPTRIVGRITGEAGQPVTAQVSIPSLRLATVSNDQGQYALTVPAANVRGQTVTLIVRSIGRTQSSRQVALRAGTVTQDVVMRAASVMLEKVVVTGTPGLTRVKELGNTIGTIDVETKLKDAPINSLQELFQGREVGLMSIGSSGELGTANNILLRGFNSLSQSNQPLIYLDGVQINQSNTSLISTTGGQSTTRLSDLAVQDIARVEVIKGASATTLYGSQASGGVIQIFTKRGGGSAAQWNLHVEGGTNRMPSRFPYENPDHSLFSANDLIKTGGVQNYDLSVRGSTGITGYYSSATYNQDNGSFPNNSFRRAGWRLNLTVSPGENLKVSFSNAYLWSRGRIAQNGNSAAAILLPIVLGDPTKGTATNPQGNFGGFTSDQFLLRQDEEVYGRFIGGVTIDQKMGGALSHRLTLGLDAGNGTGTDYAPVGTPYIPNGYKSYRFGKTTQANADYAATWNASLSRSVKSTFSAGGQLNTIRSNVSAAVGQNYSIPGLDAISGTSTQSVGESRVQFATAGVFGQEMLGFGDRLFLTGGVRVDGSSSFGRDFGTQAYPKFGASYVLSDEPRFHLPKVSSLRLRTAWGEAGRQPGAFDAIKTYVSVNTGSGLAGLIAANPGNPTLAPEVTSEWEEGFDLGLFNERLVLKATAYQQRTRDAIISLPSAGSAGFSPLGSSTGTPSRFLSNVGQLRNNGFEFDLSWIPIKTDRTDWELNGSFSTNKSNVDDLGGLASITIDAFGTQLRPDHPVSSKFAQVSNGYNAAGQATFDGVVITTATPLTYIGPAVPPRNGSFGSRLRFRSFNLRGTAQWATGGFTTNENFYAQNIFSTGERYYSVLAENGNDPNAAAVKGYKASPLGNFIYKSDYLKLREVTLTYALPSTLTGGNPASLYVSGRNLALWTKYPGADPEASVTYGGNTGGTPGAGLSVGTEYGVAPQSRYILVGVNISFSQR